MEKKESIVNIVKKYIDKNTLFVRNERILVACSGGADSVAMLEILRTLASLYDWQIHVCHVNHNIRGKESDEDALWVKNFCRLRGLELTIENVDVPKYVEENKCSPEEGARILRYQALKKVLNDKNFSAIAVAHNKNDNAETILMNIIRGSGTNGLLGIQMKRNVIVRPMLEIPRREIEEFCHTQKIDYRTDSSNKDKKYLRNKVRLELMPVLEKYNGEIITALAKTAELISEDVDFLNKSAGETFDKIVKDKDENKVVLLKEFSLLHRAVSTRLAGIIIKDMLKGEKHYIGFKHLNKVVDFALGGRTGAVIEIPGEIKIKKDYETLVFSKYDFKKEETIIINEEVLKVPGRVVLPDGKIIRASLFKGARPRVITNDVAVFPYPIASEGLTVRSRRSGDIIKPVGMHGSKRKLKDVFIDCKIPYEKRDSIALVCDKEGVLWIAGIKSAHREQVTTDTWLYLELINKEYIDV